MIRVRDTIRVLKLKQSIAEWSMMAPVSESYKKSRGPSARPFRTVFDENGRMTYRQMTEQELYERDNRI